MSMKGRQHKGSKTFIALLKALCANWDNSPCVVDAQLCGKYLPQECLGEALQAARARTRACAQAGAQQQHSRALAAESPGQAASWLWSRYLGRTSICIKKCNPIKFDFLCTSETQHITASTIYFSSGPPWKRAPAGAAATWRQCQLRGKELPGCPG
eukprot:1153391-Pelagomonas_calceolata.AAC.19